MMPLMYTPCFFSDDTESLTVRNAYSKLLPVAEIWDVVGFSLGLDQSIINEITVWHRQNPESALYEVITQWFSKHPNPQWRDVDRALSSGIHACVYVSITLTMCTACACTYVVINQ